MSDHSLTRKEKIDCLSGTFPDLEEHIIVLTLLETGENFMETLKRLFEISDTRKCEQTNKQKLESLTSYFQNIFSIHLIEVTLQQNNQDFSKSLKQLFNLHQTLKQVESDVEKEKQRQIVVNPTILRLRGSTFFR